MAGRSPMVLHCRLGPTGRDEAGQHCSVVLHDEVHRFCGLGRLFGGLTGETWERNVSQMMIARDMSQFSISQKAVLMLKRN